MSDDKNCYGGSAPPQCPPPPPNCDKPLVLTCTVPPTATFTCPASPPPEEDCKPKVEEKPKVEDCEPPKVEEKPKVDDCAPKIEELKLEAPKGVCGCGPGTGGAASSAAANNNNNSACGGNADNSCEVKPLSMTREDGSSKCGKKC